MSGVRIVRDDDEALVIRVTIGSYWQILGRVSLFIIGMLLALALISLFVLGRSRTLTCRREPAVCELREKGIVDEKTEVIPREQIVAVEVEQSLSKCRTQLRTRRGTRELNPVYTLRCVEHRRNAATINAFLASPSEPPVVVRFDEKLMFVMYTTSMFGAAAVFLLLTFWPAHLTMRIDRRRRLFSFLKRPWLRGSRVVPLARVAELSVENVASSHLYIELVLDDRSSVVARTHGPVDPVAAAHVRDRLLTVLATRETG